MCFKYVIVLLRNRVLEGSMSFLKNLFKKDEEKEEKKGFFESLKEKLSASIGK